MGVKRVTECIDPPQSETSDAQLSPRAVVTPDHTAASERYTEARREQLRRILVEARRRGLEDPGSITLVVPSRKA